MFEMYKKENNEFIRQLGYGTTIGYGEMFVYLINLFKD
jgi:hypothetical protein